MMRLPTVGRSTSLARINFVSGTTTAVVDNNDNEDDCHNSSTSHQFSGDEARLFYESLINSKSEHSNRSLQRSASIKHSTKRLLKKNTSVTRDFTDRDINRFMKAASDGQLSIVDEYIQQGINVNICDDFKWTPLMCASFGGHIDVVRRLLSAGANVIEFIDQRGRNAIDLAIHSKHIDTARLLNEYKLRTVTNQSSSSTDVDKQLRPVSYCVECQSMIRDDRAHTTSTVHLVSSSSAQMPSSSRQRTEPGYGIPTSNVGYQLLCRHGWDEYSGLGKKANGHLYPVKTILKRDRKGLGHAMPKPKVTHFDAGDIAAVERQSGADGRKLVLKSATMARRERDRMLQKERRKAADFRRMFIDE